MKKIKVIYKDSPTYSRGEDYEFETRGFDPETAKAVAANLEKMGCHSFRFVPEQEAA